jgi:hypothetical protein
MIDSHALARKFNGLVLIAILAACSGGDKESATTDTSSQEAADTESEENGASAESTGPITLTAADFDGFEKGIARETQLVREATATAASAATPQERGAAIQAGFEQNTMAAAAPVTGLSAERYKLVRETLSRILTTLDFQGKIEGPQSLDTSRADAATRERFRSDPYLELDSASAAELKSRMSRIAPLWIAYISLTALAG